MKLRARQAFSIVSNTSMFTVPFSHMKIKYRRLECHVVMWWCILDVCNY